MSIQELVIKTLNGDELAKKELIDHYTVLATKYVETRYKDSNYDKNLLIKAAIDDLLKKLNDRKKNENIYFSDCISNYIHSSIRVEINRQDDKSRKHINELVEKMLKGDALSKNKLIEHYMTLIMKFVHKRYPANLYNQEDLIQAGYVGLISAVNSYKENFDSIFPRYVKNFIHYEINKLLENEKENSTINYLDINKDNSTYSKFSDYENILSINDIIKTMPQRTKEILYLYFYKDYSFVEIGKKYNLSKQRIEQIYKSNIKMIKYKMNRKTKI